MLNQAGFNGMIEGFWGSIAPRAPCDLGRSHDSRGVDFVLLTLLGSDVQGLNGNRFQRLLCKPEVRPEVGSGQTWSNFQTRLVKPAALHSCGRYHVLACCAQDMLERIPFNHEPNARHAGEVEPCPDFHK